MKATLALLPLLASAVTAAPQLLKRQSQVSSAVASVTESVASAASSAVASATGSASAAEPSASADYGTGLLAALRTRGATTLATLLEPLAGQLVPVLQQGEWTLLAPSDEALSGADTSNATALQNILTYHAVHGSLPAADIPVGASVIPATLLQGAPAVNLPNNSAQAIAFTKNEFGTTEIIGQNASVLANSTYQNVLIKLIDNVLSVPENVTGVLASPIAANASALVGLVAQLSPETVTALASTAGLTVFAPSNEAVQAASGALAGVDPTQIVSLIQGHVLNQVVYSTNITDGLSAATLNGGQLTVSVSGSDVTVSSNGGSARVIRTDYIAANGVVHIIDAVLAPAQASGSASASGAASSAVETASSVAEGASSVAASGASAVASAVASATA